MSKSKNKRKQRKRGDHVAPSQVLLAARLHTGAGKHTNKRPRSVEKRRAIQEAS
jgi:hypothetical protein